MDSLPHVDVLRYDISSTHDTAFVRLVGALTADTTIELGNLLGGLIRGGHQQVVLDLALVERVGAVAAGVLNRACGELRAAGGAVTLHNITARAAAELRGAGLDRRVRLWLAGAAEEDPDATPVS